MRRKLNATFTFIGLAVALAACTAGTGRPAGDAGTGTGSDGGIDPRTDYATITGTVWAPGNAPGMTQGGSPLPTGHEIPVHNALIRVTTTQLAPIPDQVYCEQCVDPTGPHALSAHDGTFSVNNVVPGTYWVTIEIGQFRIEREISVGDGEVLNLDAAYTTLPSVHNPANGQYVPRIAVATGSYDELEEVLGKMSIGGVDGSGSYQLAEGSDRIDWYLNGGEDYEGGSAPTLADLVGNLSTMLQYHIIFIPCSDSSNTSALDNLANLRNIREYVAQGGKLYVTDWSGEWMDNVFPAFVQLESGGVDTPASAYNAADNTWNTGQFGDADGSPYDSDDAEAVDPDLHAWLDRQMGPTAEGGVESYDASRFDVVDSWNTIENLARVEVGLDDEGLPYYETATAWVIGSDGFGGERLPLTVTFEPAGCGRVLYSTYHTTDTAHEGLVPQERILLYLIMQIGVCKSGPILI